MKEITREIRKYSETNENKNTTYQNLGRQQEQCLLRGKFTAVNVYVKKDRSLINNLTLHLK